MTIQQRTRAEILAALQQALKPLDYVYAMWQGGAAAFNRVDQWSDIDLQVDVADDRVDETFAVIETTLRALSPIERRAIMPQPTWHGQAQAFYRLRDTSPYLLLDLVVIKHSSSNKFLERELHGRAVVHFDKAGVVAAPPLSPAELRRKLEGRIETIREQFAMFQTMVQKELNRGNLIEAVNFYHGLTLRPLVELCRIKHKPARHAFHARYIYYDLPDWLVRRLEPLFFVASAAELGARRQQAEQLFYETLAQIDLDEIMAEFEKEQNG
jgi:hypothetical protein